MIVLLILFIIFIICLGLSEKCLQLIVHPTIYSQDNRRKLEIENGFEDSILRYENKWNKQDFSLSCNGVTLSGEHIFNQNDTDKVAIVCHGHTVNRYCSIKYADMFLQNGYHVIIYDERHFGRSSGEYSTLGENEAKDLSSIIEMTKEKFGQNIHIVLHGESMGAATVLLVSRYQKVDKIIADCSFSDSETLFKEFVAKNLHIPSFFIIPLLEFLAKAQFNYHIKETSPFEAVRNCDVPICFIHGTDDKLIPCHHSEWMYKAAKNPKSQLHLFEGADHAQSVVVDRNRYQAIIESFLNT